MPRARGLSQRITPRLGGLAILAGVLVAALIWMPATIHLGRAPQTPRHATVHTWALLLGAILIAGVGAIDDVRSVPPIVKLAGQIAAAVIAVEGGAIVSNVTLPVLGSLALPQDGGWLTVIWLVALMNIVNFSDGIDGLAAGVCAIDGIAFTVIVFDLQGGDSSAAVLAALTAGAALGFLFHNFYPAKIFMGDSGSNLLGYLLGVVAVIGSLKTTATIALVGPLLILAVPFLDTSFVIAKRLKYGQAPWSADTNHFHHRMSNIGFSPRKTVAYLYGWTLMLAGVAIALQFIPFHDHGRYHLGWSIVMGLILAGALVASIYLVYVLEILKFRGIRTAQLRRMAPETSEHEIDEVVRRDVETGEFDAVRLSDTGEFGEIPDGRDPN